MNGCVFCKIIKGEIPVKPVYENGDFIIINDINPIAKKHYLLIPRRHYAVLSEMTDSDAAVLASAVKKLPALAVQLGMENGYRLIINQGADAGQSVMHLHIHILAGEKMGFSIK